MKAEIFIKQLRALAPDAVALEKLGLNEEEINSEINSYHFIKRPHPITVQGKSELVDLLTNWNAGQIEIGLIRFLHKPVIIDENQLQFGLVEIDPLVISNTNEILVYEEGSNNHVLWKVAKNPDSFLDAMINAAEFLTKTGMNLIDYNDSNEAMKVAKKCSVSAGGSKYFSFYLMLLGGD